MTKKTEKKQRDIWFVLNSLAVALIIMAVLHTIQPYLEEPDPNKPPVMQYAASVQVVKPQNLTDLLVSDNGKPTLFMVYAAWCPTCRVKMPDVIELMRTGQLSHVNTVFISRDNEAIKLAQYIVDSGFYNDITPYLYVERQGSPSMVDVLMSKGSSYRGAIPFMELYSPEGTALTFIPHYASKDEIVAATKALGK